MPTILWEPHPGRQTEVLRYRVFELLYGGARGGGKTDAGIIFMIDDDYYLNEYYRGLVIRKNADDLTDWVDRAERIYSKLGARKVGNPAVFVFPSGAKIKTGHLHDKDSYTKYQGHEYQKMLIEELTQIARELEYLMLVASCRSTVPGLVPQIFATTNPTGKGHSWVKNRFVKVNGKKMAGKVWVPKDTGRPRLFFPATIEDNPTLVKNDPGYILFLNGLPEHLRKAWRDGDWDVGAGQFFDTWREEVHEIKAFTIPETWPRYISFDYGYAKQSAVYWHAVNPATRTVYTYRELYVTHHTYIQLAVSIARMTPNEEKIEWAVADNSIWAATQESGKSGAEIMSEYFDSVKWNLMLAPANKGKGSRVRGWNLMREYIRPIPDRTGHMTAKWYVFKNDCPNLCRTMKDIMFDENNIEDLDTDGEDHAQDSCRYFLQALVDGLTPKSKEKETLKNKYGILTAQELFEKVEAE